VTYYQQLSFTPDFYEIGHGSVGGGKFVLETEITRLGGKRSIHPYFTRLLLILGKFGTDFPAMP
jgi:hypothetical protein